MEDRTKIMDDYTIQKKNNEEALRTILQAARPDIFALMEALDASKMNWKVLFHIIRALGNVALDTKYGQVNILIENNEVKFIRGEHANKINEQLILEETNNSAQ